MKRTFLLGVILISYVAVAFAQEIILYKTFGGVRFERDTLVLSTKQVMEILREKPLAFEEFKKAKANYNMAGVLGFTGGLLIGFPLGTALVGGEPEWGLAAGGAAFILGSIHFNRVFKAHALNALDIYNGKVISRIKPEFNFRGSSASFIIKF
jgi:hypothetical protein